MFIYSPYINTFFEIGAFKMMYNKHFEYSLRSIMIAHCGCAVKNKVVDNPNYYNGNPDHLEEGCAVVMRHPFWKGGSTKFASWFAKYASTMLD